MLSQLRWEQQLVKLMIGDRFVFLTSMIFSVCGSIMFNEGVTSTLNYSVGIYVLLSSLSVSIFLREKNRRTMILTSWYTRFCIKCSRIGGAFIIT